MSQLNSAYRENIKAHNAQVDKNRYILNIIINCNRFYGALELALRGHNESEGFENQGVFRELINFSCELDKDFKEYFSKATVFKDTSKTIQNELLECMMEVYHEAVISEVKKLNLLQLLQMKPPILQMNFN